MKKGAQQENKATGVLCATHTNDLGLLQLAKARQIRWSADKTNQTAVHGCIRWCKHRRPDTLPVWNLLITCRLAISVANKPESPFKQGCSKAAKSTLVLGAHSLH